MAEVSTMEMFFGTAFLVFTFVGCYWLMKQ